jgi:HEAT repeat protein
MFQPSPLPRTLEAAFRDLASKNASTRASAIRDVVRHAQRSDTTRIQAISSLEDALKGDEAATVRSAAALALADLGGHEALASLLVAVEDEDPHVRQMALTAVGEIGDPRATQRLGRALQDERPEVRYQAVIAFAKVARDDTSAVAEALLRAMGDDDPAIIYIAVRVAEEHEAGGEPLRSERLAARMELLLDSEHAAVAVAAALYLARIGVTRGRDRIVNVVAGQVRTPEIEDEQACVEISGELNLRSAVPHLERRVWGTRRLLRSLFAWGAGDGASCAWHARIALARMGHERAAAEILADLRSWRREAREAAVVASGRARLRGAEATVRSLGETGSVDAALVQEALLRFAVD